MVGLMWGQNGFFRSRNARRAGGRKTEVVCQSRRRRAAASACGEGDFNDRVGITCARGRVNEFYKKGCQEKTSASTGGREDFCLEIQPTSLRPSIHSRGFALACCFSPQSSSSGRDDANRVLKLGKRSRLLRVNHGSIGGSWPIAISGYPRGHSV